MNQTEKEGAIRAQTWIVEYLERIAPTHPDVRNMYLSRYHAKNVLEALKSIKVEE